MTPHDFRFADSLRALVGWNQTFRDWQRFLACEPEGCFVAECQGSPAGTATTICYGSQLGWIGMLLVHPDRRRCGVGSALLQQALHYLRGRGVHCVRLDATPLGKPLYERFGFKAELCLARWECQETAPVSQQTPEGMIRLSESDMNDVIALDQEAFGCQRRLLLTELSKSSLRAVMYRRGEGKGFGFGMIREGSRALYLGPVVANTPSAAESIVQYLLNQVHHRPIFWDILDQNTAATRLAQALGFRQQRPLLRMSCGEVSSQGNPSLYFALADPAVG